MDFCKLKLTKYIKEAQSEVDQASSDKATASVEKGKQDAVEKKNAQLSGRASSSLPTNPKVVYNSFDVSTLIGKKELIHMRERQNVNWREELAEEEQSKEHPYVDICPGSETETDIRKLLQKGKSKKKGKEISL